MLETIKSTLPAAKPVLIRLAILLHYNPYALLITWNKLFCLQIFANSGILSGTLGAKQLVVDKTHKILSAFNSSIFYNNIFKLVVTIGLPSILGITIGIKFAVEIHFKHVF